MAHTTRQSNGARRLRLSLLSCLVVLAASAGVASSAMAAPVLNLDIHRHETNFAPGSGGIGGPQYWLEVSNVSGAPTSGLLTLTVNLPSGITRDHVTLTNDSGGWSCPGDPGDSVVTCVTATPLAPHVVNRQIILGVDVAASAVGDRFARARLNGGGAVEAPPSAGCAAGVAACAFELTELSASPAPFGIATGSFNADFYDADGLTPVRAAGSHPDLATFSFDFNTIAQPSPGLPERKNESGNVRHLRVDLPPGFIGNPTAVSECAPQQLIDGDCPPSSQVGRIDVIVYAPTDNLNYPISAGVYNMEHPRGTITDLAFQVAGNPVHVKASLDPAKNYAITTTVSDINETLPPYHQKLTIWGVPAHPSHDSERCGDAELPAAKPCPTDFPRRPFISVPSQCSSGAQMKLDEIYSWQDPSAPAPSLTYDLPGLFNDCESPRFEPEVAIEPTGKQANTPTGLDVHIKVAQNENPNAQATPPVKSTTVTLPDGMSFSPAFADGLQSCSLAQMKLGTNDPIECPDAARIGEVELHTPLLPKATEGSMYLAAQRDNPFGSLFGLYLVLHDVEERGALIKIPGRIDVDPVSGQISTVFNDLPQFPFDDLVLKFRSGPRAPLVNPPRCGKQTIGVEMTSYAQPQKVVDVSSTYDVSEGPNGTLCPADPGKRPFAPKFSAGTLNPVAGGYSPFAFRLSREDQEQELSRVSTVLPQGLVAKIAGIPFCSEQAIASISGAEGAGLSELNRPACPPASQVGTIAAGLGAGPGPNYFGGKVYLAGPYKGAPLSLAVVVPGLAGPFDLGNVVVRAALYVNQTTTQVRAVSDPFPTIQHGVILRTRDIRLLVGRQETTLNPTSCERMSIEGIVSGLDGALFNAASPFQVGSCASLAFQPRLGFRLSGGTHRGGHPSFRATLTMPSGGANIASASVALPHSEFLDQSHIRTVCTRVQFAADACPAGAIYGTATAKTPLLDEPLRGNVYLRSSDNPLPDLVVALRGKIDVNLVSRIDSVNGGIRNSFDFVPDAPVERFTLSLAGGKKGLLVNSRNICTRTPRAIAKFKAQNGDAVTLRPALVSNCGEARKGKRRSDRRFR